MKTGLGEEESATEIEDREKPVKKDAQGLLNSVCISYLTLLSDTMSHLAY